MFTDETNIDVSKTETGYSAVFRDYPDVVGYGSTPKEAIGDLIYKCAEKNGKITSLSSTQAEVKNAEQT